MRIFILFIAIISFGFTDTAIAKNRALQFIQNGRQWPTQVRYKADVQGGAVFLTNTGFTYSYYSLNDIERIHELKHKPGNPASAVANEIVHGHAYNVNLVGCNSKAQTTPQNKLANYYNYFLGNDSSKWSTGMAAYEGIRYDGIYTGIDLSVYSKDLSLKYDFIVAPSADATLIQIAFDGVMPTLTKAGDISIKTTVNQLLEKAPYAYQVINGVQKQVPCRYVLKEGKVSFIFPDDYDHSRELVIDPVLVFATYSGATSMTFGWSAAYDLAGNLYAGGEAFGVGWPTSTGAFQITFGGGVDDGINKYSTNGTSLIYSTYFGGNDGDYPNTMVVNAFGELVIAGATLSTNLPVTTGCFDNTANGLTDIYVVHFNAGGTALLGSTYLGGTGSEGNISIGAGYDANKGEVYTDAIGNIFVTAGTNSSNFPVTPGACQATINGPMDAFVFKLNSTCSNLIFSTYLGGAANDAGLGVQVNNVGNVVVCGGTNSNNFPNVGSGWQGSNQGTFDGFIATLNSNGTAVLNATYVGTPGNDNVSKIQIDPSDNVYAVGPCDGTFPVSSGTYSATGGRTYLAKFNNGLNALMRSTLIGGPGGSSPTAFLLDVCGNLYYVGNSGATAPLTPDAYQTSPAGFWMCVVGNNMNLLKYASFFGRPGDHIDGGSSHMDRQGIVYHAICTNSSTQPTTPNSYAPTKLSGSYDIASWKFNFDVNVVNAAFSIGNKDTFCTPAVVNFTNNSQGGQNYLWKFGDSTPNDTVTTPSHIYTRPGTYRMTLYAYDTTTCNLIDSAFHTIYVRNDSVIASALMTTNDSGCIPYTCAFTNTSVGATSYEWIWGDGSPNSTTANASHTYPNTGTYTIRLAATNPDKCNPYDTATFTVTAHIVGVEADFAIAGNDSLCLPGSVEVINQSVNATSYLWDFGDGSARETDVTPSPHIYTAGGTYTIKLWTYNNYPWVCIPIDSAEQIVHVIDLKKPAIKLEDVYVCIPAEHGALKVEIANFDSTMKIAWEPLNAVYSDPTRPSVTVDGTRKQTYTVTVTSRIANLCSLSTTASAIVKPVSCDECLFVPNAFTPNNDGLNDDFGAVTHCPVSAFRMSIYSRWGEELFNTYSPEVHWDGVYKGVAMPLGTYFFRYTYKAPDGRIVNGKGDVTLVR